MSILFAHSPIASHLDNLSVTILKKTRSPRARKLMVDYRQLERMHPRIRRVDIGNGESINEYRFLSHCGRVSYKLYGNIITISLARSIWNLKSSIYARLIEAVLYLFENGIIESAWGDRRAEARYWLRTRATLHAEHAIDCAHMPTPGALQGHDRKGKRYRRGGFTRLEVFEPCKLELARPHLKASVSVFLGWMGKRLVKKHVTNIIHKVDQDQLAWVLGVRPLATWDRWRKRVTDRIRELVHSNDIYATHSPAQRDRLAGLQWQNLV